MQRKGQAIVNWLSLNNRLSIEPYIDQDGCLRIKWCCPELFYMSDEEFNDIFKPKITNYQSDNPVSWKDFCKTCGHYKQLHEDECLGCHEDDAREICTKFNSWKEKEEDDDL